MSSIRTRDMVRFQRSRFVARFPRLYRYSPAHFWLDEMSDEGPGGEDDTPSVWRVGLTHFATRMLGEIVEFDVETAAGESVELGQVIGWAEGMKAVTDLYSVLGGELVGTNETALGDPELVCKDPYGEGWLYAVRGTPDENTLDVEAYLQQLGETIDAMEAQPWKAPEMAQ